MRPVAQQSSWAQPGISQPPTDVEYYATDALGRSTLP